MHLKISDLEQWTGISKPTLRYYESIGLVSPVRREGSNYRNYTMADLVRLVQVKQINTLGLQLSELPGEALVRWFALCRCLTSFGCISSADDFLRELKLDGQTIRCCSAASCISLENHTDVPQVKRFLRDFGEDAVRCAFLYYDTYNSSNNMKLLSEVLKKSEPWSLDKLALKGSELVSLGLKGQEIGRMQKHLLNMVIDDPASNSRDCLISIASADMERIRNER